MQIVNKQTYEILAGCTGYEIEFDTFYGPPECTIRFIDEFGHEGQLPVSKDFMDKYREELTYPSKRLKIEVSIV